MQMRYLPHRMSARFFDGMRDRGVENERLFTVARNLPPVSMFGMHAAANMSTHASGGTSSTAGKRTAVQHADEEALAARVALRSL